MDYITSVLYAQRATISRETTRVIVVGVNAVASPADFEAADSCFSIVGFRGLTDTSVGSEKQWCGLGEE